MPISESGGGGGDVTFGVRITADGQAFINGVRASKEELEKLTGAVKGHAESTDKATAAHGRMTESVVKGAGAVEILKRAWDEGINLLHEVVDATEAAQLSQSRLEAVLRATGGAAGQSAQSIARLAEEMSHSTAFDDRTIKNAATTLLTFKEIAGDTFERVLRLSADLAATGRGDIDTWVVALAKVGTSPVEAIGSLERVLGKLDPQMKVAIQNAVDLNDKTKAQKILLDEVAQRVGGTAQQTYEGLTLKIEGTKKAWDEFLKAMGNEIFNAKSQEASVFEKALGHMTETFKSRIQAMKDAFNSLGSFGDVLRVIMGLPPELAALSQQRGEIRPFIIPPVNQTAPYALRNQGEMGPPASLAGAPADLISIQKRQQLREQDLANLGAYLDQSYKMHSDELDRERTLEDQRFENGLVAESSYYRKIGELGQAAEESDIARIKGQIAYTKEALGIAEQQLALARDPKGDQNPDKIFAAEAKALELRSKLRSETLDLAAAEEKRGQASKDAAAKQYAADLAELERLTAISRDQADYERTFQKHIDDLEAEARNIGLTDQAMRTNNETRSLQIQFDEKRLAIIKQIADEEAKGAKASPEAIARLKQEIEELQKQLETALGKVPQIMQDITDHRRWADLANGMADAFKVGWDALVNGTGNAVQRVRAELERDLFDWIWAQFARPIVLNIIGNLAGLVGLGGLGSAAQAAGGGVGGGIVSSVASSGLSWLGQSALGAPVATAWGNLSAGYIAQSAFMTGASESAPTFGTMMGQFGGAIAKIMPYLSYFAIAIAGAAIAANQYAQGWRLSSGNNTSTSLGGIFSGGDSGIPGATWMGSAMDRTYRGLGFNDQWAAILSGSSMVQRMFGRRARQQDAVGVSGTITPDGVTGTNWQDWSEQGGWFANTQRGTNYSAFANDQQTFLTNLFGGSTSLMQTLGHALGVDSSATLRGYSHDFNIQTNENGTPLTDAQLNQKFSDLLGTVLQEETERIFHASGDTALEKYVHDLTGTSQEVIQQINDIVGAIAGLKQLNVKDLDIHSLMAWAQQGETIGQTFQRVAGMYTQFDNAFMSEGQKFSIAQKQVTDTFRDLGIAVPTSTQTFYDLVHSISPATEAGRHMIEQLMQIAPAFMAVSQATAQAAANFRQVASSISPGYATFSNQQGFSSALGSFNQYLTSVGGTAWTSSQAMGNIQDWIRNPAQMQSALAYAQSLGGNAVQLLTGMLSAYQQMTQAANSASTSLGNLATSSNAVTAKQQVQDGIGNWLRGLFLSNNSPLTPFEKLDYAHNAYTENLLKAQHGDIKAGGNYTQLAQAYLDQLASYYGTSSPQYMQAFAAVTQQGAQLADLVSKTGAPTAKGMADGFQSVVDAIKQLQTKVSGLSASVEKSGKDTAKASTAATAHIARAVSDGSLVFGSHR